jgi:protein-S-isoprenylcysteine O-methyltransferase Ste14
VKKREGKTEPEEHNPGIHNRRTVFLRSILYLFIFVVILFVPAGRLDWWAGWALFTGFILAVGLLVLWARRNDPALMAERQNSAKAENVKGWDKVIMSIYSVVLLIMLVLASFDAGRMGWSQIPLVVRLMGWLGLVLAYVLVWRVMVENTFLSERVRIQDERGHQVVSTGPYRIIRHPMYAGIILAMFSLPIALGSWWALIPAVLIVGLFIIRTALEDRTLLEELTGYQEYARKVRYRLLPGIW